MKIFILYMAVQNMPVTTQEKFSEIACERAVTELSRNAPWVKAWCMPKNMR